jgi:hypothetical protein
MFRCKPHQPNQSKLRWFDFILTVRMTFILKIEPIRTTNTANLNVRNKLVGWWNHKYVVQILDQNMELARL